MLCETPPEGSQRASSAMVITAAGNVIAYVAATYAASGEGGNGVRVRVATFDKSVAVLPAPPELGLTGGSVSFDGVSGGDRVHFGGAWWGAAGTCAMTVDGEPVALHDLDPAGAVSAHLHDFVGAAAATASLWPAPVAAGAGTALSYTRASHGFQAGFFNLGTQSVGLLQATGPSGERVIKPAVEFDGITVMKPTDGVWTYKVTAGAGVMAGFPVLWILDLPI
ncbi:MAG: hypothetical protein QOF21_2611 [Actinomycetota bacterium]